MKKAIIVVVTSIILLDASSLAEATTVDISVATDKPTYVLGEGVKVFVTAYNPNPLPVTLFFGSSVQASYLMDGVFRKVFTRFPWVVIIPAYNTHTWKLRHGPHEMTIYPLAVGTHTVVGEVVGYGQSAPIEFEVVRPIDASIEIDPHIFNIQSKGKWLTCHIWLPEDYNVADIEPNSVRLEKVIPAEWIWFEEEQEFAIAKFSRSELQNILELGDVELTITGELIDGTIFEGTDTIKVLDKARPESKPRPALVNSNSKVEDGIEYYIQTDKSVYKLGEQVQMLYRVTNLRDEDVTFSFPHFPVWNFWVEKDGEYIYRAVNGWFEEVTEFTLSPGETKQCPYPDGPSIWNMRDREGNLVTPGEYHIIGGLYAGDDYFYDWYDYTKVAVTIKIVGKSAD